MLACILSQKVVPDNSTEYTYFSSLSFGMELNLLLLKKLKEKNRNYIFLLSLRFFWLCFLRFLIFSIPSFKSYVYYYIFLVASHFVVRIFNKYFKCHYFLLNLTFSFRGICFWLTYGYLFGIFGFRFGYYLWPLSVLTKFLLFQKKRTF